MNKKLELVTKIIYIVEFTLIIFMLLYMCFNIKNDIFSKRPEGGFRMVSPDEFLTLEGGEAPLGVYNECVFNIGEVPAGGSEFVFFTSHESIEMYIDDELVYSLYPSESNVFSKTTGNHWNYIPLYSNDSGKTLRVLLFPNYDDKLDTLPEFYLGAKADIFGKIISESILLVLPALAAIILGAVFIIFTLINYHKKNADKSPFMMGLFSMCIGLWKLSDFDCTSLVIGGSIPLTYISYFTLLVMVVPFVLFIKQMFSTRNNLLWYFPCIGNLVIIFLECILQIAGVADLRELLWMTHVLMLSIVVVVGIMIRRELATVGWTKQLRITLLCLALCLVGLVGDVAVYYASNGETTTTLGMSGFLVYIALLGAMSVKHAQHLMAIGIQAKQFEEMAYHDQLTGLFNRTAYAEYIGKEDFNPNGYIVVMLDLNNLKTYNDTMGHDKGDSYIITSARLIKESFGEYGHCYRMGGDEFCVLLSGVSMARCISCAEDLKTRFNQWNSSHPEELPLYIACGYQQYNPEEDYDIGDTLRKADKLMYSEKYASKHKNNEEVR